MGIAFNSDRPEDNYLFPELIDDEVAGFAKDRSRPKRRTRAEKINEAALSVITALLNYWNRIGRDDEDNCVMTEGMETGFSQWVWITTLIKANEMLKTGSTAEEIGEFLRVPSDRLQEFMIDVQNLLRVGEPLVDTYARLVGQWQERVTAHSN